MIRLTKARKSVQHKDVILLTSCVYPAGMIYTALQDPIQRLSQYHKALDWYLKNTDIPIVIADNSGYNYSNDFKDAVSTNRLEVLSFYGNDYDKQLGKGYGEAKIIRYAIEHSEFIKQDSNILKITGRLIIKNINVFSSNGLKVKPVFYGGKGCCESYFFIAPVSFFCNYFLKDSDKINDSTGYYFEHHLYKKYMQWKQEGHPVSYFFLPVIIDGISGSKGTNYNEKSLMRQCLYSLIDGIANYMGYCKNQ